MSLSKQESALGRVSVQEASSGMPDPLGPSSGRSIPEVHHDQIDAAWIGSVPEPGSYPAKIGFSGSVSE